MYVASGELIVILITTWWLQKLWGKLAVSKQAAQKLDGERINLRKLRDLEVKKQYQIEIINRFAALGTISDDGDINRAWEN